MIQLRSYRSKEKNPSSSLQGNCLESHPPVVSGSTVVGSGTQDALDKDKAFSALLPPPGADEPLTMEKYNELLKIFTDNPATGCTTVMDMARIAAGFNPLSPELESNQKAFDDYVTRIMRAPFFFLNTSSRTDYQRGEKNWDVVINSIVDLYEGIESQSKQEIKKSLISMARAATSRTNTRQTKNLFAQSTIDLEEEIQVYIYSSTISLEESERKGSTSKQTDIAIIKARLTFYKNLWPSYAQTVMNRHVKLVNDWLDENTTKPGIQPINLTCFKPPA